MASKKGFTFRPREPGSDEESSHSNSSATSESDDELEVDNFDDTPNSFKGLDRDLPISEKQEKESVEGVAKTPFSEPWEDSDLIFVVEEEKFHVHRQIMSIHSPVFKAMFTSVGFKEATATEIPLPGKKADEFLPFLKLLYVTKYDEVQLNQVEHVLKLADEYQAAGIIDVCVKILKSEPKSEGNAVKILQLATCTATVRRDERLFWVRERCYKLIENMELKEIKKGKAYHNLEKGSLERVLVKRNERLETFIKDIYPQFMGLVECCLWDSVKMTNITKQMDSEITPCPQHYQNRKAKGNLLGRMKNCSVCRRMITHLVRNLKLSPLVGTPSESAKFKYGGDYYFDEKVIAMIQDFEKIIRV